MDVAAIAKPNVGIAFPAATVEAVLRDALVESVKMTADHHGIELPDNIAGQCAALSQIDSLVVVALLCAVEPIVGFELKDGIVKSGGYSSINEAINHVMPGIGAAWQKHNSHGGKK